MKRRDYIIVLAAAAAAKKRKNSNTEGNSNTSAGASDNPNDVYSYIERGFDNNYLVDESSKNMGVIFIEPLDEHGKSTFEEPHYKDMYFYLWIDVLTNEIYLAYQKGLSSKFNYLSLNSNEYKEFTPKNDRLVNTYVRPLELLITEGIPVIESNRLFAERDKEFEL